ncbi:hypothetical protein [Ornithinibacillus contaminans]|uniref:hypothetical protein n=1 Tax=Ornithinibacillus contaminans TaxID=694055 RepID=UPI0012ECBEBB|nr:hypothetical protein [Ornithinibacillus contaminans]
MAKKEVRPELDTYTILNPDFYVPLDSISLELKEEKEVLHGNGSQILETGE